MPRKIIFLVLGIFLYTLSSSSAFAIDQLQNGDFENENLSPWESVSVTGTVVSDEKQAGNQSLKISTTKTSFYYVKQRVSGVNLSKQYKISSYIKKGINLQAAKIKVAWYEAGGTSQIGGDTDDSDAVTNDTWSLLEYNFVPRANAAAMEIRLSIASTNSDTEATAYFDNVSVEELDLPTPTPTAAETPTPTASPIQPSITLTPTPKSAPTKTPTPFKTPTPKKKPTPAKSPTPTRKPSPPIKKTKITPTKKASRVLGAQDKTSTSSNFMNRQSGEIVEMLILIGVLFGISSVGMFIYSKYKKPIDSFLKRKFKKE